MGDDCEYLGYSLLLSNTQTFPGRTTLSLQGPAFYLVTRVTGAHTPATTLTLRALICCATGVHCPNADGSEGPLVNACYVWLPIEMHTNGAGPTGLPLQINNYANWSLDNPFSPAGLRPQPPAPPSPPPAPTPVPPGPPQPTPKGYTQHMGQYCSDHGGKQIFTLHMPTLAECAAQCSTNAACKSSASTGSSLALTAAGRQMLTSKSRVATKSPSQRRHHHHHHHHRRLRC
jgi:hypothetical protein